MDYDCDWNPEEILEEYEVEIREILTKAIDNKIKNTIKELESCCKRNAILEKDNDDLRNQVKYIERKTFETIKKALKDKELEVMREFTGGFAPHDVVYFMTSSNNLTKCEKCGGKGETVVEVLGVQSKVKCPHCNYGNINHFNYFPQKDTVDSIYYNISKKDSYNIDMGFEIKIEKIYLDKRNSPIYPHDSLTLYKTLEECQIACDKKNKKIV